MTVGIVGMGAAGIRAATRLESAGVAVQLFEARDRVGGRLYTMDTGDGCRFEAGGEWIDSDHFRTLGLLRDLGLSPLDADGPPKQLRFLGSGCSEDRVWPEALEDDLRVEAAAQALCRPLKSPPWLNVNAADLDRRTLAEFLAQHTRSERGLAWITAKLRSDEGDDPERIGLLGWLAGYAHYLSREGSEMSAYRFPGGASAVMEAAIHRLSAPVEFNRVLQRVRQDASGVTLTFEGGDVRVDRVILTLPPRALERVVFEPALSGEKRSAIEACHMSRTIKISLEFSRAWWTDIGWSGSLLSDTPLQQVWESTFGERPVLNAYINGQTAVHWTTGYADPVATAVEMLRELYPEMGDTFRRGWITDWINDPYAGGGFSDLAPNYVLPHMRHIASADNLIHFAGEHTAMWTGFIEGAIESGDRVAEEVLAMS